MFAVHLSTALLFSTFALACSAPCPPDPASLADLAARFQSELRANPNSAPANLSLAAVFLKLGKPRQALPFAQKAVSLDPGNSITRLALADAWLESGNSAAAFRLFEELSSQPSEEVWFGLAKSALDLSRQAARRLQSNPAGARLWKEMQKSRSQPDESPSDGISSPAAVVLMAKNASPALDFQRVTAFHRIGSLALKELLTAPESTHGLMLAAAVFEWVGQYPESIRLLQRAILLQPDNGQLWAALGKVQWRNIDFEGALASLQKAFDLNFENAESNYVMGDLLARSGAARKSIPFLQKSVASDPRSPARAALAHSYSELQDFRGAIRELTAIAPPDRTAPIEYQLYRAYSRIGQATQAQAALREFRRLTADAKHHDDTPETAMERKRNQ